MIDELVKTVRLHLSERLTSPLLGAFFVSWSVWNFRLFLVIFSSAPIKLKLEIIDSRLYSNSLDSWTNALIGPMLTTAAVIFIYPIPAKFVYEYSRKRQRDILEVRRRIEGETPLTLEDSRRLKKSMEQIQEAHYVEIGKKDGEIERLTAALAAMGKEQEKSRRESRATPPAAPNADEHLTPKQRRILEVLAYSERPLEVDGLFRSLNWSVVEKQFVLDELIEKKLVTVEGDGGHPFVIELTHKGRAAYFNTVRDSQP